MAAKLGASAGQSDPILDRRSPSAPLFSGARRCSASRLACGRAWTGPAPCGRRASSSCPADSASKLRRRPHGRHHLLPLPPTSYLLPPTTVMPGQAGIRARGRLLNGREWPQPASSERHPRTSSEAGVDPDLRREDGGEGRPGAAGASCRPQVAAGRDAEPGGLRRAPRWRFFRNGDKVVDGARSQMRGPRRAVMRAPRRTSANSRF